MTSQEIIDKLTELDIPTSVAQDQNNDPYTLLEKINYVLSKLEDIDKNEGTEVKVAGVYQKTLDFVDDPQDQITNLTDAVALNVEGIAHMNEIKQDKLSQTDLDNIAGLNDLQDKLDAKANQSEVTQLATAVENNTTEISKKLNIKKLSIDDSRIYQIPTTIRNLTIIVNGTFLGAGGIKLYTKNSETPYFTNSKSTIKMELYKYDKTIKYLIIYDDNTITSNQIANCNKIEFTNCYGTLYEIGG